jgi:hypothetical protein
MFKWMKVYSATKMPKVGRYVKYGILVAVMGLVAGIAWAAFSDEGKVLGGSFTVASADIKLIESLGGGLDDSNLKDELPGPIFNGVYPGWTKDYPIKIYNKGSLNLLITSNSNYTTANDPDDLRSYIYVEPIEWNDADGNGEVADGELGTNYGKKTIIKWKTEGYDLGELAGGAIKGLVLRFSGGSTLSDTKQGKTGIFDFEFSSIQL